MNMTKSDEKPPRPTRKSSMNDNELKIHKFTSETPSHQTQHRRPIFDDG